MRDRSGFWVLVALCVAGAALILAVNTALATTVEVRYDAQEETQGHAALIEAAMAECPPEDAEAALLGVLEVVRGLRAFSVSITGSGKFCVGDFVVLGSREVNRFGRAAHRAEDAFFLLHGHSADGERMNSLCAPTPLTGWLYVPRSVVVPISYVYQGQIGRSR